MWRGHRCARPDLARQRPIARFRARGVCKPCRERQGPCPRRHGGGEKRAVPQNRSREATVGACWPECFRSRWETPAFRQELAVRCDRSRDLGGLQELWQDKRHSRSNQLRSVQGVCLHRVREKRVLVCCREDAAPGGVARAHPLLGCRRGQRSSSGLHVQAGGLRLWFRPNRPRRSRARPRRYWWEGRSTRRRRQGNQLKVVPLLSPMAMPQEQVYAVGLQGLSQTRS
mmetsp:Transcript_17637/g.48446  ORF Transcript_17637/g.48446 Transcript_17637/m.48446 type:complete len:228 (-) Transcript_17637:26-709(-)